MIYTLGLAVHYEDNIGYTIVNKIGLKKEGIRAIREAWMREKEGFSKI